MHNDVIKGILKYYSNNTLLQLFVYPYIKQDTLQQLADFNSLSPLSSYLYECCRELEDAVRTISQTKGKYVIGGYLVWQSIPDDKDATSKLREFLKRRLNFKWIDYSKFEKTGDGNTLRISYRGKSILIALNDTRTKAFLKIKNNVKLEFTVREYVKENMNSKGCFVVEIPSEITKKEGAANFLMGYTRSRVSSFLFNLILSVLTSSDDFRILSQDKTFLDTLEETKTDFINKCELLANMRSNSLSSSTQIL